jgi:hypothetical protein
VDLVRFEIKPINNAQRIEWESAAEYDNVGYNLYGAYTLDGERYKLNRDLIPAMYPGTVMGAEYWFLTGIGHNHYWLEDVDMYGVSTIHGPADWPLRRLRPVRVRPIPGGLFFRGR